MKLDVKIKGIGPTISKFDLMQVKMREAIVEAMTRTVYIMVLQAKENIQGEHGHVRHVKTGNLFRSIDGKAGMVGLYEVEGVLGTDVPYAPYIEALPDGGFLLAAIVEKRKDADKYFRSEVKKIIREMSGI